jgi:membrane fusion protein, multidrug efflux system
MKGLRRAVMVPLILAPALLMTGCGAKAEKSAEASVTPKVVPVTLADVEHRSIERSVGAVGTLKGWDEVTVGAKKIGRVAKVRHDIGDRVAPGELLVEFETIDANLALEQAKKQLLAELAKVGVFADDLPIKAPSEKDVNIEKLPTVVQAQVALDRAKQNLGRERSLMTKGAGMRQDLQNTENDVRNAEAAYDNAVLTAKAVVVSALSAWVMIQIRTESLKDMEIRAPKPSQVPAGLNRALTYAITKKSVSEGQMIKEGEAAFELVIENPLRVWLNIPERFVSEVEVGQEVRISVASYPRQTFPAKVSRINPMVDSSSRTFQVEAAVPNDEGKLRPGGFAKAEIITERNAQAIIVPLDAIVRFAGVTKVFVVQGDEKKARSIAVETGKEGPGWVELLTPLPENARVVTTGQSQLGKGEKTTDLKQLADETPIVVKPPQGSDQTKPTAPDSKTSGG